MTFRYTCLTQFRLSYRLVLVVAVSDRHLLVEHLEEDFVTGGYSERLVERVVLFTLSGNIASVERWSCISGG